MTTGIMRTYAIVEVEVKVEGVEIFQANEIQVWQRGQRKRHEIMWLCLFEFMFCLL